MDENNQKFQKSIDLFKVFLVKFIKPYCKSKDDNDGYAKMMDFLSLPNWVLHYWAITTLESEYKKDKFQSYISNLEKELSCYSREIEESKLLDLKSILINILSSIYQYAILSNTTKKYFK